MHWQSVTPQYYNYMFRHGGTIPKLYRYGLGFPWIGENRENETEFYYGSNITVMESKEKENVRHVVFITEAVDCCNSLKSGCNQEKRWILNRDFHNGT